MLSKHEQVGTTRIKQRGAGAQAGAEGVATCPASSPGRVRLTGTALLPRGGGVGGAAEEAWGDAPLK